MNQPKFSNLILFFTANSMLPSLLYDYCYSDVEHKESLFIAFHGKTTCINSFRCWSIPGHVLWPTGRYYHILPTRECSPWEYLLQLRNVKRLRLLVSLTMQELPGMSCLLRSCTRLKTLVLNISVVAAVESVTWERFVPNAFKITAIGNHKICGLAAYNAPLRLLSESSRQPLFDTFK